MNRYEVIADNYGFQSRYWTKGEVVEIAADTEKPPVEHFRLLDGISQSLGTDAIINKPTPTPLSAVETPPEGQNLGTAEATAPGTEPGLTDQTLTRRLATRAAAG